MPADGATAPAHPDAPRRADDQDHLKLVVEGRRRIRVCAIEERAALLWAEIELLDDRRDKACRGSPTTRMSRGGCAVSGALPSASRVRCCLTERPRCDQRFRRGLLTDCPAERN
jgi:hypothetical protein